MVWKRGDEPIPGYRLEKPLGQGNFGVVWSAAARGGTQAALKILSVQGQKGLKEFRSIQRVKTIQDSRLIAIHSIWILDQFGNELSDDALDNVQHISETDEWEDPDQPRPSTVVIVMEMGQKTLHDRRLECDQSQIPSDELLGYMERVAGAIDLLTEPIHDLGHGPVAINHGDIKPKNVVLVGRDAKLCDYGLARILDDPTATGIAYGTPAYQAPECHQGGNPSRTSDQYSLAITYYELRTGKLPFSADKLSNPHLLALAHFESDFEFSLITAAESLVLARATSPEPKARFETAGEFVQSLHHAIESGAQLHAEKTQEVNAPPDIDETQASQTQRVLKPPRKWLVWALSAAGFLAVLMVLLGVFVLGRQTVDIRVDPLEVTVKIDEREIPRSREGTYQVRLWRWSRVSVEITPSDTERFQTWEDTVTPARLASRIELARKLPSKRLLFERLLAGELTDKDRPAVAELQLDVEPEKLRIPGHPVQCMAYSPAQAIIVAGSGKGAVTEFKEKSGVFKESAANTNQQLGVERILKSRDGRWSLFLMQSRMQVEKTISISLRVIDEEHERVRRLKQLPTPSQVAFTSDSRKLAVRYDKMDALVWNLANLQQEPVLVEADEDIRSLHFRQDELIALLTSGAVRALGSTQGPMLASGASAVECFAETGQLLIGTESGEAYILDGEQKKTQLPVQRAGAIQLIRISPDNETVFVGGAEASYLWRVGASRAKRLEITVDRDDLPIGVPFAFAAEGRVFFGTPTSASGDTLNCWILAGGDTEDPLKLSTGAAVRQLAGGPQKLVASCYDGVVRVWSLDAALLSAWQRRR